MSAERPGHLKRNIILAGGGLAIGIGAGLGIRSALEQKPQTDVLALGNKPGVELTVPMPTNTVEFKGVTATIVPYTPESISTPPLPKDTPTQIPPTEKPATPTTAPATSTATVTATAVEQKPLLPVYGAFAGNLTDKQTGGDGGMIVVANIPQKGIFVWFWDKITSSAGTMNSYLTFTSDAENLQPDGTFQVSKLPGGVWRIQAQLDPTGKVLTGEVQNGIPGRPVTRASSFQAELNGTGKTAIRQDIMNIITQPMINGQVKPAQIDEMMNSWPAN